MCTRSAQMAAGSVVLVVVGVAQGVAMHYSCLSASVVLFLPSMMAGLPDLTRRRE